MNGAEDLRVRVVRAVGSLEPLVDWGPVGDPARGGSRTRGVLIHRGAGGSPEAGVWECTPGAWECRVTRDEFCHFLSGRCVYTHASGERTEIRGGDTAFFPRGWTGTCEVLETVRKAYLIC
jgi:hypothetical protein